MSSKERRGGGAKSNRTRSTQNAVGSSKSLVVQCGKAQSLSKSHRTVVRGLGRVESRRGEESESARFDRAITTTVRTGRAPFGGHRNTRDAVGKSVDERYAPVVHVREVLSWRRRRKRKELCAHVGEDEDEKSNREDTSMSSAPQEGSEYSNRQQSQAKAYTAAK